MTRTSTLPSAEQILHAEHALEIARLKKVIASKDEEIKRLALLLKTPADRKFLFVAPKAWRLSNGETNILEVLANRGIATRQMLMHSYRRAQIAGEVGNRSGNDPKIIDVYITRLRQKLRPFGFSIESLPGRAWLVPAPQREELLATCVMSTS